MKEILFFAGLILAVLGALLMASGVAYGAWYLIFVTEAPIGIKLLGGGLVLTIFGLSVAGMFEPEPKPTKGWDI